MTVTQKFCGSAIAWLASKHYVLCPLFVLYFISSIFFSNEKCAFRHLYHVGNACFESRSPSFLLMHMTVCLSSTCCVDAQISCFIFVFSSNRRVRVFVSMGTFVECKHVAMRQLICLAEERKFLSVKVQGVSRANVARGVACCGREICFFHTCLLE
jgi:hypothetical protein